MRVDIGKEDKPELLPAPGNEAGGSQNNMQGTLDNTQGTPNCNKGMSQKYQIVSISTRASSIPSETPSGSFGTPLKVHNNSSGQSKQKGQVEKERTNYPDYFDPRRAESLTRLLAAGLGFGSSVLPPLHLLTNPDLTTYPTASAMTSTIAIYLEVGVEVNQEMGMETHLYKAMDVELGTSPSSTTVLTSMTGPATTATTQGSTRK